MEMSVEISVVILCYRTGNRAHDLVKKIVRLLDAHLPSYEIILVGNYLEGDDDHTPEAIQEIASRIKNVKALTRVKRGMMGWDAREGMAIARGNYIGLIDGDEQIPSEDIIRVYEKIKTEDLDFVQTYRTARFDGIRRRMISRIYNQVFRILFPSTNLRDINAKPKMISRAAYEKMKLTADDWFLDAEMVLEARRLKLKTGEIPTTFYKCVYRKSFVKFKTILEFIKNLWIAKMKDLKRD